MFVSPSPPPPAAPAPPNAISAAKRKRRPAGTPDPEAEVVSLSPRTLLESDRYVCEICNQGFQRDQNLQMHRRRHKVPWKLLKRESGSETRKRVFVCPEPSCLHHDPAHALGDLVGIKKHFRRKHSAHKQWACARCTKAYAVQSDYKAHLKTCGTRGHSCDCGRVFSRVESFIEHQDTCNASLTRSMPPPMQSPSASSQSPSSDQTIFVTPPPLPPTPSPSYITMWPSLRLPKTAESASFPFQSDHFLRRQPNIELQLLPIQPGIPTSIPYIPSDEARITKLELTIGPSMSDEAKRQMQLADDEFANAKRIRQQAQLELDKAFKLRESAARKIQSVLLQITCLSCKQKYQNMFTDD